jgi:UDP:flavonoid glycosyltransferase YjiC (YdhE family)
MRILFTFAGGSGHADPLVPIARVAEAAGHTVAFTGRQAPLSMLEALGFSVFATPGDSDVSIERIPLRELDAEREDRVLREGFARRIARLRATGILAVCGDWTPDLVVCEEVDFGSVVAAERLGLPHATVLVIAAGSFVRHGLVAGPLNALRAEHGLPPDPDLQMLSRYLVLSPFPPSYRDPAFPLPATAHTFRLLSAWNYAAPPALTPTVYFTLGTVFNLECGDLFARVLAGLRDLAVDVVATVGPQIDPEELGPLPGNFHVERYIPQSLVLPRCSAVVSHGGSGSVLGALAHGLPMVLIPMGADQPLNAARCEELRVARVLDAVEATPEMVREAVSAVLSDPTYRTGAERLRDEIAALPGPAHALTLLERLGTERRPVVQT